MTEIRTPTSALDAILDLRGMFEAYQDAPRAIVDRPPAIEAINKLHAEVLRLQALAGETDKLTDEQAEGMLKRLTKHFREPVQPVSRYCEKLQTWGRCISERAGHLRAKLFPHLYEYKHPEHEAEQKEYNHAKMRSTLHDLVPAGLSFLPQEFAASVLATVRREKTAREHRIDDLLGYEEAAHQVERTFLAIHKSNLLARLIYSGEKLRTQRCPEHDGKWSGIEWSDSRCPHKCQLTGWVQEQDDTGKPLPGVFAVTLVPTGEGDGKSTMIRDVDGEVLGKAVVNEIPKPKT